MTFNEQVYELVRHIPAGKLLSYSAVAKLLGVGRGARAVGWALRASPPDGDIPWHRVINAQGYISTKNREHAAEEQRIRLEAEGIQFGIDGKVDLAALLWKPSPWEVRSILEKSDTLG